MLRTPLSPIFFYLFIYELLLLFLINQNSQKRRGELQLHASLSPFFSQLPSFLLLIIIIIIKQQKKKIKEKGEEQTTYSSPPFLNSFFLFYPNSEQHPFVQD
jgi:hypothetical protein